MNQSSSGSAGLSLNDVVDAITRMERAEPWRDLLGKAALQVTDRLPIAGNDVLVIHTGWLANQPRGLQWLVLLNQDTLDAILDVSRLVLVSGHAGGGGFGAAARPTITERELAAHLAYHARTKWEADRAARLRCSCQGVVNLACPEHGNIS